MVMAAVASRATARAASIESARARVTPTRRWPSTRGLPNRRSAVSGARSAASTPANVGMPGPCASIALEADGPRCGMKPRSPAPTGSPRRARVQHELAEVLRDQGHQAGVVRPRGDLAEPDLVAFHEQLHAEHAPTAEVVRDGARDLHRTRQRARRHRLRLPAFAIVAIALQ